jgi:hypothetical protein
MARLKWGAEMRIIFLIVVVSILSAMAIKPALIKVVDVSRQMADADTDRYVAEELDGVIRNDVSIFFPDGKK